MPHACITDVTNSAPPITISTTTGQRITSIAAAQLNMPTLPSDAACKGHIMPGFTNNLVSIGQLCDEGCTATFTKQSVEISDALGRPILLGTREPLGAKLWRFNLAQPHQLIPQQTLQNPHSRSSTPHDDTPTPQSPTPVTTPPAATETHQAPTDP